MWEVWRTIRPDEKNVIRNRHGVFEMEGIATSVPSPDIACHTERPGGKCAKKSESTLYSKHRANPSEVSLMKGKRRKRL
jgi:hypothetical protein